MDSHGSHITANVIAFCMEHTIDAFAQSGPSCWCTQWQASVGLTGHDDVRVDNRIEAVGARRLLPVEVPIEEPWKMTSRIDARS